MKKLSCMTTNEEKSKKRRAKLLPGAGAGSNWVDQGRQEPKKRPWYRIDFF
jgi:hypothetical protein